MANLFDAITSACVRTADMIKEYIDTKALTETDPTVPAWAKASSKPAYSAEEITDLAEVAKTGSYNDLTDKPEASGGGAMPNYVEGEVALGCKWIDGKPIYRQVIKTTVAKSTQVSVMNIPDAETFTRLDGTLAYSASATDTRYYPLSYMSSSSAYNRINTTSNQVYVYTCFAGTVYVIAEYTKSTDSAS